MLYPPRLRQGGLLESRLQPVFRSLTAVLQRPHRIGHGIPCVRRLAVTAAICAVIVCTGCLSRRAPVAQFNSTETVASNDGLTLPRPEATDAGWAHATHVPDDSAMAEAEPTSPDPDSPSGIWDGLLEQTRNSIQADQLVEAQQHLSKLEDLDVEPTTKRTDQLAAVRVELENHSQTKELRAAVQTLAAPNRDEVLAAQERLFAQSAAALPLLQESARAEQPSLVKGTLEMLRRLRQPEATLPIMVGVLERPEQEVSWPDAVREIKLTDSPGAGDPLLELAVSSKLPQQRLAALHALAEVNDPPPESLVALLPTIHADGPELAAALKAACHALTIHGQRDLLTQRGWELELTGDHHEQLAALPDRLAAIMGAGSSGNNDELVRSATMLALATRQVTAEPIAGIKILAYGGAMADSQVATALDGQWNTVDPKLMWRHPLSEHGSLVLDLGRERTVTGVRIWNLNEKGGGHRGWKEVTVSVGLTAEALSEPAATGIIPQAPGAADQTNFSTTIPVRFVCGRYVRLRADSVWRADGYAGLTEVQVLGF